MAEPARPSFLARRVRPIGWSVFGLFAVWFGWNAIRSVVGRIQFEDQLIVLRYARNLVEGHGLVYNVGERVQGFTTPLWTLLSVIPVALGGDAAPAWQNAFGVVCILGTAFFAARLLLRLGAGAAAPLAAALIAWLSLSSASDLFLGMEVHLFALLLLLALDLHLANRFTLAAVVSALLFLTRPEGVLLTAMLLGHRWHVTRRAPLREAAAALATVLPWLLFATIYYGSPVTSTLQAKQGLDTPVDYAVGFASAWAETARELVAAYAGASSSTGFFAGFLGVPLLAALIAGAVAAVKRRPQCWPLPAFPVAWFAGFAVIGAPVEHRWHYHFVGSVSAILLAVFVHACFLRIRRFAARVAQRGFVGRLLADRSSANVIVGICIAALSLPIVASTRMHLRPWSAASGNEETHADPRSVPGPWLSERYDRTTSILALEIGFLGWQSPLRIIDNAGLITPGLRMNTPGIDILERYMPDLTLLQAARDDNWPWMYHRLPEFDSVSEHYHLYARTDPRHFWRPARDASGEVQALLRYDTGASGAAAPSVRIPIVRSSELLAVLDATTTGPPRDPGPGAEASVTLRGWAFDTGTNMSSRPFPAPAGAGSVDCVVAVVGDRVVTATVALPRRPDVAAVYGDRFVYSGFRLDSSVDRTRLEREGVVAWAVSSRGIATRLHTSWRSLEAAAGGLEILPSSDGRRLPVQPQGGGLSGALDRVERRGDRFELEGWAADVEHGEQPRRFVVYRDGEFLGSLAVNRDRPDVVRHHDDDRLLRTGFLGSVAAEPGNFADRHRVFAVMGRGAALELPDRTRRPAQTGSSP